MNPAVASHLSSPHVLIVGAGHAGSTAASLLRQAGHEGKITLVGDEAALPYQRPSLSKGYLKGEVSLGAIQIKPQTFYEVQNIVLRTNVDVTHIDPVAKSVRLGEEVLSYDILVLATGVSPRTLPQLGIPGNVLQLRTAVDSDKLKQQIGRGKRMAIIGGGYIGLEVAASARMLGADVTIIEREARVLARVASEPLSRYFARIHRERGVTLLTDAQVERFEAGPTGEVQALLLCDGQRIECDVVLVGIGAVANDSLARAANINCSEQGIVVTADARTSWTDIYAIGDVTCRPVYGSDRRLLRLESIQSATEQARQMVCAVLGKAAPEPEVPWFWSDQYDLKLQIAGLLDGADAIVVRGDPNGHNVAFFHLAGSRLIGVEAINSVPEFMAGKQLIKNRSSVDAKALADKEISLKDIANPPINHRCQK